MGEITRETSLYEVLIRVRPDGSWAAQYQTITDIKEDGLALEGAPPTVSPVMPLNTEDSAAFAIVEQLIGNSAAKNLILIGELQAKVIGDAETIEDLESHIYAGNVQVEELLAKIKDLQGEVTE